MNDTNMSIRSLSDEEMDLIGGGSIIPINDNPIRIVITIILDTIFGD